MKILIMSQPFGLGDQIFTQTIAHDFREEGYKIVWPVTPGTEEGLKRAYPKSGFINRNLTDIDLDQKQPSEEVNAKENRHVRYHPLRFSEWLMGKQYRFHMESKYSYLGKDWKRWKEHAMPRRVLDRERALTKALGLKKNEKYNLLSLNYGTEGKHRIDVNVTNGYRNLELAYVPGFSLFDWCGVIQRAITIHAVSSSTLYLFEILNLQAEEVHLYPRKPIETNFDYVQFLFTKDYKLHG